MVVEHKAEDLAALAMVASRVVLLVEVTATLEVVLALEY